MNAVDAVETSGTPPLRIALAGNPNSGKTTAFNAYTGSRQHVGNYPGVTVDKKEGTFTLDGQEILLIDLPGTYSLTAYSQEELVTRAVLSREKPLAVVDVVDASSLERTLFLALQIMEMGLPLALALNMMDEARKAGIHINTAQLARNLGVPVVECVARTGEGLHEVLRAAIAAGRARPDREPLRISYGSDLDPVLQDMERLIEAEHALTDWYAPRWLAVKIMEGDEKVRAELGERHPALGERLDALRAAVAAHLKDTLHSSPEAMIADYRYGFIRGALSDNVISHVGNADRMALTDKLDKILTNALFGPLIMLGVLYLMFTLTIDVGSYPQSWLEAAFSLIGQIADEILPDGFFKSLVTSGIIAGVGGVVSFVPLIMIMFLFVAFLEDSGYMARIAYMVDRVFRAFGLHGSSVMPYIIAGGIAGGCAIPGVMATRTLRSPREKLATILTLPYLACGAKLPVFLLLVGVFFPENAARAMFLLTLSGWAAALLMARLLRSTIIRGESTPFVMELPPYRLPTLRSLSIHCWERTWMYLKKAGTVLVAISVIIWATMTFPRLDAESAAPFTGPIAEREARLEALDGQAIGTEERSALEAELQALRQNLAAAELRHSLAGRIGQALEPFTRAAGFDWRTNISLLAGIAAKEAVVTTLGTAFSLGDQAPEDATPLAEKIAGDAGWTKATALSLMLFVLLYSPCSVTLVVIRQETGSWGWVAFSMICSTSVACAVAVTAYQIGLRVWL